MSHLEKHVKYFADESGQLSYDLMNKVQANIGSSGYLKSWGASDAIMYLMESKGAPPTVDTLLKIPNSAATGLWNLEGNVDAEKVEKLQPYVYTTRDNDGKDVKIVTKTAFGDFIKEIHNELSEDEQIKNKKRDFTKIRFIQSNCPFAPQARFSISRDDVTNASYERLFDDFYDRELYKTYTYDKVIKYDDLIMFYENSPEFFKKFEKVPRSDIH